MWIAAQRYFQLQRKVIFLHIDVKRYQVGISTTKNQKKVTKKKTEKIVLPKPRIEPGPSGYKTTALTTRLWGLRYLIGVKCSRLLKQSGYRILKGGNSVWACKCTLIWPKYMKLLTYFWAIKICSKVRLANPMV